MRGDLTGRSRERNTVLVLSVLVYLGVWELLSLLIGRSLILPGPAEVLRQTLGLLKSPGAWLHVGATSLRALGGFFLSLLLGILFGGAAGLSRRFQWFFDPLLITVRSIPVLSLILLAIIWFSTELVPLFICFLIAFPVIASSVAAGVREVDRDLLEVAAVYRKSRREVFRNITLPSMLPYLLSGLSTALGLTWKSVVAAEILSMPRRGLGTAMQTAQLQLDTAGLFAWTLVVVVLAGLSEVLIRRLGGRLR